MYVQRESLSDTLEERIRRERETGKFTNLSCSSATRRLDCEHDRGTLLRPAFMRDADKILYCPFYNRYNDKTQVVSLYKDDDISRRGIHVQIVSKIAREISRALNLNADLAEAIALGHDIGHTPFGHDGERHLDKLFYDYGGRHFSHELQSVRVLDEIFPMNLSLQTLSGIAGHNGEQASPVYHPSKIETFEEFDSMVKNCYTDNSPSAKLHPNTLEGCVVRVCDIISYIGKDRSDAEMLGMVSGNVFEPNVIGSINTDIINNMVINIVEHSYGEPFIAMDEEHFNALKTAMEENYQRIYYSEKLKKSMDVIQPMMVNMFKALLSDMEAGRKDSPIYRYHIRKINKIREMRGFERWASCRYEDYDNVQIVVDFIASMTDDYFIELYNYMGLPHYEVSYTGYFDMV